MRCLIFNGKSDGYDQFLCVYAVKLDVFFNMGEFFKEVTNILIYKSMKHIKKFDTFKLNENTHPIVGGMLQVNLLDKYKDNWQEEEYRSKFEEYKTKIKGFTETSGDLKAGDIIEFTCGYNSDIRCTTEILGFDGEGDIYLLWDSFWYPIRREEARSIKVIKKAE